MENKQNDLPVIKHHQIKISFNGDMASVTVNGSDMEDFDISNFPENIVTELLRYGWKQKVSDYRAADKLRGNDKKDSIAECHQMMMNGTFRQKSEKREKMSFAEQLVQWNKMSDENKTNLRSILGNHLTDKLIKASE